MKKQFFTTHGQLSPNSLQRWEHLRTLVTSGAGMTKELDGMGREGWELVTLYKLDPDLFPHHFFAVFKRPDLTEINRILGTIPEEE